MSVKTDQKRPVRASAVVRIVVWSVVFCILAGVLAVGLLGNYLSVNIFGMDGIINPGGFFYEDASTYHVGNATTTETITDLSINWLTGKITVIASDTNEIKVVEDYSGDNENLRLRWKVEEGELKIQFRKPVLFGNAGTLKKNLTVAIPAAMLEGLDEVEISAVSCDVSFTGNADELTVDTVAGDLTVNGDIGELGVNAVEGNVIFRGGVRKADLDCVDATVTMHLDMAAELNFDQVDGDVALYLAEEIVGFAAEMDSLGGEISVEGFDDVHTLSGKHVRWGDGSLRIRMDGVDAKLDIKKATKG